MMMETPLTGEDARLWKRYKVMKEMGGKADPKTANEILQRLLG